MLVTGVEAQQGLYAEGKSCPRGNLQASQVRDSRWSGKVTWMWVLESDTPAFKALPLWRAETEKASGPPFAHLQNPGRGECAGVLPVQRGWCWCSLPPREPAPEHAVGPDGVSLGLHPRSASSPEEEEKQSWAS